jgi:hypothetical protein
MFPAIAASLRLLDVDFFGAVLRKGRELGREIGMPLEGSVGDRLDAHVANDAATAARGHGTGDITGRRPAMAAAEAAQPRTHG